MMNRFDREHRPPSDGRHVDLDDASADGDPSAEGWPGELDVFSDLRGVACVSQDADGIMPAGASFASRWWMPEPFEATYAYPVLAWVCRSLAEYRQVEQWVRLVGRQNAASVAVLLPAATDANAAGRESGFGTTCDEVAFALGQAWLTKPESLTAREDRVYGVGVGEAAGTAVRAWLGDSAWLAGAAAIAPSRTVAPPRGLARQSGRLLVTGSATWSKTAAVLYAAGADVELRPTTGNSVDAAAQLNAWMMRAIPTAVGVD